MQRRVEEALLKPLTEKEKVRSRFSRARLPPHERRVRVLQATAIIDASGREYVPFAVDVRYGDEWQEDDIVGCAYPQSGALFVKHGDAYRPAGILLGKRADPAPAVCVPGKPPS
ncbi:hypothetical protein [Pendulispora albinea]|uniref:Uncharacterized protein n=1 Tax=Pendulispora albinea TaxID=2741071 RepID=A0ABZ2LT32_9BACT